eukprot:Pgem_evm1s1712
MPKRSNTSLPFVNHKLTRGPETVQSGAEVVTPEVQRLTDSRLQLQTPRTLPEHY